MVIKFKAISSIKVVPLSVTNAIIHFKIALCTDKSEIGLLLRCHTWRFGMDSVKCILKCLLVRLKLHRFDKILFSSFEAQTSQNRASGTNDSVILDIDSSSVTFDFRTDGSVTDRGFKIEYKAVPEEEKEQSKCVFFLYPFYFI